MKSKEPKRDHKIEIEHEAWSLFERAVDQVIKAPPQHKTKDTVLKQKPKDRDNSSRR